jgi:hypothetical protein
MPWLPDPLASSRSVGSGRVALHVQASAGWRSSIQTAGRFPAVRATGGTLSRGWPMWPLTPHFSVEKMRGFDQCHSRAIPATAGPPLGS